MSLIDSESCECVDSSLDIFSVPSTQTEMEQAKYDKSYPISTPGKTGPIEFTIPATELYIDPSRIFLYLKLKILDGDGDALPDPPVVAADAPIVIPNESKVAPINYFHATQFKSVEIYINGKLISTNNLYAYRAYFETVCTFSDAAKKHQMECALFHKDVPNMNEHTFALVTTNTGLKTRFEKTQYSNTFETYGKLHSDILNQEKFLIPGCELRIILHRNDPKFSLMAHTAGQSYSIQIDKAVLFVRRIKISDSVREAHQLAILKTNAKYPVKKVDIKFFTRGANRSDISEPNLCTGILPRKVLIGLVRTDAFSGSLHYNPFNFSHFNVSSISLRNNGSSVPFETIDVDYANDNYKLGYMSLMQATGHLFSNSDNGITLSDYKDGYTIYGFDITPDESFGGNFQLLKEGKLSLDLTLNVNTTHSITIVAYFEYDGLIQITHDGAVIYE